MCFISLQPICGSPAVWYVEGSVQNCGKRSYNLKALSSCVAKTGMCVVFQEVGSPHG